MDFEALDRLPMQPMGSAAWRQLTAAVGRRGRERRDRAARASVEERVSRLSALCIHGIVVVCGEAGAMSRRTWYASSSHGKPPAGECGWTQMVG